MRLLWKAFFILYSLINFFFLYYRCNNYVEFFHNFKWFSKYPTSCLKFNSNECLGWSLHVFHIRIIIGICMRELCGKKTSFTQCCISSWRKSCNAGIVTNCILPFFLKIFGLNLRLYCVVI